MWTDGGLCSRGSPGSAADGSLRWLTRRAQPVGCTGREGRASAGVRAEAGTPETFPGFEKLDEWDSGRRRATWPCVPGDAPGPGVTAPPTCSYLPRSLHAPFSGGSSGRLRELGLGSARKSGRLFA